MKIAILGAMEAEVDFLKNALENSTVEHFCSMDFFCGKIEGKSVVVVKSGIGKVNASICAQTAILKFGADIVINTGIAGAIKKDLQPLDFVVSSDAIYHDVDATFFGYKICQIPQMSQSIFCADENLINLAICSGQKIFGENHKIQKGRIASGDQFICDSETKNQIIKNCSPACVEMEGAAIAHTCFLNQKPFVIIRCMSDTADENLNKKYEFNEKVAAEMSAKLVKEMLHSL